MGKKDTNAKPATPAQRAATPAAASAPAGPKKAAAPKKPAKATAPKRAAKKAAAFTTDDIALRAYFIAEKRRAGGIPGDEAGDWIEAERQLKAEHAATA